MRARRETSLPTARPPAPAGQRALGLIQREPMVFAAVILFLAFAATAPVFSTLGNVENILRQAGPVLLLGHGMTAVVLAGGIDLSAGSVALACAIRAGLVLGGRASSSA